MKIGITSVRFAAAFVIASSALFVPACSKSSNATEKPAAPAACPTCVVADEKGFTPSLISLKSSGKGDAREVTFTRTSDATCARDVVFPELGIKQALPLNQPVVIKVPVDAARTLTFQCGMGMYKSSVVVTSS
jgi:plastocyanin domain-containing protein